METNSNARTHFAEFVLVGLLFCGISLAWAEQVKLDVALGNPTLLAGQRQKTYLRVALTGSDLPDPGHRPPINVAFVLDKSGSMQGEKLARAKQAVFMAIDRLREDDIVSVVAYDTNVQVLVPATRLSDRNGIHAAIEMMTANNSTALFAGVSKGAAEIRKFLDKDRVNRIILLSDGLANVGPSSPGDLGELGTSLGREGITVTTIGLGLDYNEDLMTKLAQKSDGNHMFAENAADLERTFAQEFGDVLTVVAQKVNINIHCADGIRPVRILGREADIVGQTASVSLNQLYGRQMKYVVLEVEVPTESAGTEMYVATVDVSYLNMANNMQESAQRNVSVNFTESPAIVEASANADVMAAAVYQIGVERNIMAMKLRDEGRITEAQDALRANAFFLGENAIRYNNRTLDAYSKSNGDMVINWTAPDWDRQRKSLRVEQHTIINQQQQR